jgi:PIN domain nuclease of toxin-antitoxin system
MWKGDGAHHRRPHGAAHPGGGLGDAGAHEGEGEEITLVLDTCAVIWSILAPEKLSAPATEPLTERDTEILVSPISCAEIACAVERGRLILDRHWKPWFRYFVELNGWRVADIDLRIVSEAYSLPEYEGRDPADRIIIATARTLQCPVVTADRVMLQYPHVETVW